MLEAIPFLGEEPVAELASYSDSTQMGHKMVLETELPCVGFLAFRAFPLFLPVLDLFVLWSSSFDRMVLFEQSLLR